MSAANSGNASNVAVAEERNVSLEADDEPCPCMITTADLVTLNNLSRVSMRIVGEINRLHTLLASIICEEDEVEFQATEKRLVQELIQKKYALLNTIDSMRADLLDPDI